jgi:hypothetical protein
MHGLRETVSVAPSDAALNYLAEHGLWVRWNADEVGAANVMVQYPDALAPNGIGTYIIQAPQRNDLRVVENYYDVHPNEPEQKEIGLSLEEDPMPGVRAFRINTAASPGARQAKDNINLICPGNRHAHRNSELYIAYAALRNARMRNPDIGFELHNTFAEDEALIYMKRNVSPYVGRVALYLSREYDMPLVEASPGMFSAHYNRSLLVEMPLGSPRFTITAWREFLERLVHNDINLPKEPGLPQYSFHSDLTRKQWLAAGQKIGPRRAFEVLDDDAAEKLGLPKGARTINWIPEHPYPGVAIVPLSDTSNPHDRDPRKWLVPAHGHLLQRSDEPSGRLHRGIG